MGPTKIGRGSWTSWVHQIAKPVRSAAGELCQMYELSGLPGSSGTYPFLCMRLGMTHGRPSRAFAPRQRRLDALGQSGPGRRAKIESPGVLAGDRLSRSAGSGSHRRRGCELDCPWAAAQMWIGRSNVVAARPHRRRGYDVDCPWTALAAPCTPEGPRAPRGSKA